IKPSLTAAGAGGVGCGVPSVGPCHEAAATTATAATTIAAGTPEGATEAAAETAAIAGAVGIPAHASAARSWSRHNAATSKGTIIGQRYVRQGQRALIEDRSPRAQTAAARTAAAARGHAVLERYVVHAQAARRQFHSTRHVK